MADKVPDPSAGCPRCHYFEVRMKAEVKAERALIDAWPQGIDQHKAQELLNRAFPQKQRAPR